MGLFIPTNKLHNLKLYKYLSEDHSLISKYVLKKWWNYFVQIFPLSMAPNMVTLLGLFFIISNLFVVFYYDPFLNSTLPRWCYFFYAFGLFMYQTFDGCDGMHARRTGQSGPLGELFDHSIDAINTTLGSLVFASVMKMGYGGLLMLSQFASVCNFYTSTWEEYHTHKLFLSKFSGPVEGILMICTVYILTGVFGPDIWNIELFELNLTSLGYGIYQLDSSLIYVVLGLGSLYFNIISAMHNVAKHYEGKDGEETKKTKSEIHEAYKGLYPFFVYYGVIIFYAWIYPSVVTEFGFPLVLSIGCTIAFSVGRIILAHLTIQEFPFVQIPMFIPIAQLAISKVLIDIYGYNEYNVLNSISWLGFGVTLGIHGIFVGEIITEITSYLDIYALSIKHKRA
ncbi:ethanolaminephosphotransferase [Lodderomyces elongisporus NRRL YB-4239]|uniref:diacylglycerol cholinephosphotransferase n=1 Tax=Lodderomyces elongisporus (strain ATCC 11503 / CBS 2605 / JCM 1781 / NBRC 1676 / NRRL YB-4239) TaxID=379508 RepID=A5E676_LODEL|nr:ethanolaminephosphotransferase [Lodderomyces elongisporus NRRL YB-4239]